MQRFADFADDPDYLLQLAAEKWRAGHNYALGDLVMPTRPNGTLVARDPAYPLDAPKTIEKSRAKAEKETELIQEKTK